MNRYTCLLLIASAVFSGAVSGQDRFHTDRPDPKTLALPEEDSAFVFAVYGDRTGGPASGIEVLKQAVKDTNLIDPDLVLTVGDLVEGYNTSKKWIPQMREFTGVMNNLNMPWFPVAGNHDIYWRGPNRPKNEHESEYEQHFGPLWFSFDHKDCTFIALYTDEPNKETGERNFNKPECQRMSDEQLSWLKETLNNSKDQRHVFVFMHHPRWLSWKYGDDWEKVHRLLAGAGNVTAVFAGHIHRMRYDGKRDGIEHFALATTGGHLNAVKPEAGYLHHFNVVTVRDEGITVATLPVGSVLDPKTITAEMSDEIMALEGDLSATQQEPVVLDADGSVDVTVVFEVKNTSSRDIDVMLAPVCHDRRVSIVPDHAHSVVKPGGVYLKEFRIRRPPSPVDENFAVPEMEVSADWMGDGLRVGISPRSVPFALQVLSSEVGK